MTRVCFLKRTLLCSKRIAGDLSALEVWHTLFICPVYEISNRVFTGVAHRATKDIIWVCSTTFWRQWWCIWPEFSMQHNYCIPAGASVVGNHWSAPSSRLFGPCSELVPPFVRSIGQDPVVFPNPEKFDPQRWLTGDGKIRQDLKVFSFGFGRRWDNWADL